MNDKRRFYTRDCKACGFWGLTGCQMTSACSTFTDLFAEGTFYSAGKVADMCMQDFVQGLTDDCRLAGGQFVDCDGIMLGEVPSNPWHIVTHIIENDDIVGILMPGE